MSEKKERYGIMKDAELMSILRERNLQVPLNEENRLVRNQAVSMLKAWDDSQPKNDTKKKVRVVFHSSNNPSAGSYVFASINDKNFQAPFEKEVVIPEYFLKECIDRAITIKIEQKLDEMTGQTEKVIKKIPTYPYTIIGYCEEDQD